MMGARSSRQYWKRLAMYPTTRESKTTAAKTCPRNLIGTVLVAALVVLAACETGTTPSRDNVSGAATPGSIRWEMQSSVPSTQPIIGPQGVRFSNEIAKQSDGEIKVEFLKRGSRVPWYKLLDAISSGQIDAGYSSPLYLAAKNPGFEIFAGSPFGLPARDHYVWLREGGGLALHDELYAKFNIKAIPCVMTGPNGFGWFRKAVQTPDDLKGLKMRILGPGARVMSKLGVAAVPLPGGEIYNKLDRKLIDAAASLQPYIDVKMRLDRVVEHYYYPSFHRPFTTFEVMFNLDRWKSLSTEQQRLIEDVSHENVLIGFAEDEQLALEALDKIRSRGVAVHEVPPAIWAAARQAWAAVAIEESRRSADFRRIYRDYQQYLSTRPAR